MAVSGATPNFTVVQNTSLIFLPKAKVEVAVPDDLVERTVEANIDAAKTGKVGDGKIFVTTLDQAWRIRTGETGDSAL